MAEFEVVQTAKTLSQAVAPVFLISGIGVLISNMVVRYGRVIDRVRSLLKEISSTQTSIAIPDDVTAEIKGLYGRAKTLRLTIILATLSIFCVSATVALIFANMMFQITIPHAIEWFFLASLVILLLALVLFIEDFAISLRILKIEIKRVLHREIDKNWPP